MVNRQYYVVRYSDGSFYDILSVLGLYSLQAGLIVKALFPKEIWILSVCVFDMLGASGYTLTDMVPCQIPRTARPTQHCSSPSAFKTWKKSSATDRLDTPGKKSEWMFFCGLRSVGLCTKVRWVAFCIWTSFFPNCRWRPRIKRK